MADQHPAPTAQGTASPEENLLPGTIAKDIRKLSHDLSNALEIIVQTSYLLGTVELKDPANEWLRMLDDGVNRALSLNNLLRTYIREHSHTPAH